MDPTSVKQFVAAKGWSLRKEIEEHFGPGETLEMMLKFLVEKHHLNRVRFEDAAGNQGEMFYVPRGGNR